MAKLCTLSIGNEEALAPRKAVRGQAARLLAELERLSRLLPASVSFRAGGMLFGRRSPRLKRILVVEDEPLVAFDNEHLLRDAGYTVVATVDRVADALAVIHADGLDLVLSDVRLSGVGDGIDVARAARDKGVPLLFVTGACPPDASSLAVGCLGKPYSARDLLSAIEAVDARLAGRAVKRHPDSLTLFG